jgi:eukaryotic-like serine/threonine-protein kinase
MAHSAFGFHAPAPPKCCVTPKAGEVIINSATGHSYRMGHRIGGGYFSDVYSCVDSANNHLAAKVLKPTGTYEKVRASAIAEFQKLSLLRHPYIISIVETFECRDTFYLITERCNGSLEELFSKRPWLGPQLLIAVADCVLQAMDYIHGKGYVHQDAHMGNVLTFFGRSNGAAQGSIQFKLGDLGVAKFATELDHANTRAASLFAPELLDPEEFGRIDHRIDLYHVGIMLLRLAYSRNLTFSPQEIVAGQPREMALALRLPYVVPLEKLLRRHVDSRPASATESLLEFRSS